MESEKRSSSDLEKHAISADVHSVDGIAVLEDNVPRQKKIFAPLWRIVAKLDRFGVEARGIERVPENERHHESIRDNMTLWMSANMGVTIFGIGCLGNSIWFMGFRDAVLTILFFNLLANAPVAWFATFGKSLGLRQMTFGRFSFGYYGVLFPVALNLIACLGWATVNLIAGASCLQAVSTTHTIPVTPAVIVIAASTLVITFFGYKVIHAYERWAGIPQAIIFFILLGLSAHKMTIGPWGGTGALEASSVLSFGATIVGSALGWASFAADYTVNMPKETSSTKLFWYTYVGLNVPQIFCEILGAAMMTAPDFATAYSDGAVGGLLAAGLEPVHGFGKFLLVLLAFSIVAGNTPNIYSFSVTFQVLSPYCQAIPRCFLALFVSVLAAILAAVGAHSFNEALSTLLLILAYWLAMYSVVITEEHLIFRKNSWSNYVPDDYTNWRQLPLGVAAITAIGFGWLGAAMGMSQVWYVGPIAKLIGDPEYGADLGFELSGSFTALIYPIARYYELKYWHH